jgi:hypothetical protein
MDMAMDNVEEDADHLYENILGEIGLEYSLDDPVSYPLSLFLLRSELLMIILMNSGFTLYIWFLV